MGRERRLKGLAVNLSLSVAATVVFFAGIEIILSLLGVRPIVVEEDPYVGFQGSVRLFEVSEDGQEMRTASNKLRLFNQQKFPRHKASDSFRIFTLGGSTTYGRPYNDATSFSAWLRELLTTLDPDRQWEVVNCGGISYASYRVAVLMEELVEYEPDLFIIYSGNNEFLESRTYPELKSEPVLLTRTRLLLQHSRLWSLARSLSQRRMKQAQRQYELTGEVRPLLDTAVGLDYYYRDEEFNEQVFHHYQFNLRRMVGLARANGADVIFVSVPVNEGDFSPFKSQHRDGLSRAEQDTLSTLLLDAGDDMAARDWAQALAASGRALDLDPLYAESHFVRGRALMGLEVFDDAEHSFAAAIAEDVCPLRASERTNAEIVDAAQSVGESLVDFRGLLKEKMAEHHGHRILGDEFFLDHVHPTVEAHGELAMALVDEMGARGFLNLVPDWRVGTRETVERVILSRIDAEATAIANKNLSKVLLWAGKNREAQKYIRRAEEAGLKDWEVHFNAALVAIRVQQDYETAFEELNRALDLRPDVARAHDLLSSAYLLTGQVDKAIAAANRAVSLDPGLAAAWHNLGLAYLQANDLGRSLEAVNKALNLDPGLAEAFNTRASIQLSTGQPREALESSQKAIALKGGDFAKAKINAGYALGDLGRFKEAKSYFLDAVGTNPDESMARLGLALTLVKLGDPEGAILHLDKVLEFHPNHQAALELRSRALRATASRR